MKQWKYDPRNYCRPLLSYEEAEILNKAIEESERNGFIVHQALKRKIRHNINKMNERRNEK